MLGEFLSKGRRFLASLPAPPKLDARALCWWGIGLFAISMILGELISHYANSVGVDALRDLPLSGILFSVPSFLGQLGVTLVAVAFGVRSLAGDASRDHHVPEDSGRQH